MDSEGPAGYKSDLVKLRETLLREQIERHRRAWQILLGVAAILFVFSMALLAGMGQKPEWQTIVLVGCASLALALPLFSKINVSKDGGGVELGNPIELLNEIEERAREANGFTYDQLQQHISALSMQISELAKELTRKPGKEGTIAAGQATEPTLRQIRSQLPAPTVDDDPQSGRFGGSNQSADRILTAEVSESVFGRSWQKVVFTVSSRDGSPLRGTYAYFFLHDTFSPDAYRVKIKEGATRVELETASKGAFTAGVVTDRGKTKLELDLASPEVKAPRWWKSR